MKTLNGHRMRKCYTTHRRMVAVNDNKATPRNNRKRAVLTATPLPELLPTQDSHFPLERLPPELLQLIILQLPQLQTVRNMMRSCRKFRDASNCTHLCRDWLMLWHPLPLHAAVSSGDKLLLKRLIAAGCPVDQWSPDRREELYQARGPVFVRSPKLNGELRAWVSAPDSEILMAMPHLAIHRASFLGDADAVAQLAPAMPPCLLVSTPKQAPTYMSSSPPLQQVPVSMTPAWMQNGKLPGGFRSYRTSSAASDAALGRWTLDTMAAQINEDHTPLHLAAVSGSETTVSVLLSTLSGSAAEVRADGWAALHLAAVRGSGPAVSALINGGSFTEIRSQDRDRGIAAASYSALHLAAMAGKPTSVVALLKGGADVHARTAAAAQWRTPLHLAACCPDPTASVQVTALLLAAGADPNARDACGATALDISALQLQKPNIKLLQLLFTHGSRTSLMPEDGWSPLLLSAESGNIHVVELLLKAGASIDQRAERTGTTALMVASRMGHTALVIRLLSAGARPDLKRTDGDSALDLAKSRIRFWSSRDPLVEALEKALSIHVKKDL